MTTDFLDYGKMIDEAMHYVVRKSLTLVEKHGLPEDHHFYITFDTCHPGVMISKELKARYPEEMTIVVQHQFWDLEITDKNFSIVLSFNNVKQSLTVPYDALISFADPSVKFGLQFHTDPLDEDEEELELLPDMSFDDIGGSLLDAENSDEDEEPITDGSNVVTLDNFRKEK